MKNIFSKSGNYLKKNKRFLSTTLVAVLFAFLFISVKPASASTGGYIMGVVELIVGSLSSIFVSAIGLITTVLIQVLVGLASYSEFVKQPTVVSGWVIVRDVCNMSFIIILLVIAFATILRQENYNVRKMLPKLLIMAVLINFSKSIFGFFIDISQVIMMTFVAAFASGGGYFVDMFKMKDTVTFAKLNDANASNDTATSFSTVLAMVAGAFASFVTLAVLGVIVATLAVRIVMIWIYLIMSPLFFLGLAFPPLGRFTNSIWDDFVKQLITGPVLAFFIWLALLSVSTTPTSAPVAFVGTANAAIDASGPQCTPGLPTFFCNNDLIKYILTVCLLMGGLMTAQRAGGAVAVNSAKKLIDLPGNTLKRRFSSVGSSVGSSVANLGLQARNMSLNNLKKVGSAVSIYAGQQVYDKTGGRVDTRSGLVSAGSALLKEKITKTKAIKEAREVRGRISDAISNLDYKRSQPGGENAALSYNGADYKEYTDRDGKVKFGKVRNGKFIGPNGEELDQNDPEFYGNVQKLKDKTGAFGGLEEITAHGNIRKAINKAFRSDTNADALRYSGQMGDINKKADEMVKANIPASMIMEKASSPASSQEEAMAAMILAFKKKLVNNHGQASQFRDKLKSNPQALAEADKNIKDSGFGDILYDMGTDEGKAGYMKELKDGTIKDVHPSRLTPDVIETHGKALTPSGFNTWLDKVSSTKEGAANIENSSGELANRRPKDASGQVSSMDGGNLHPTTQTIITATGDLSKAFEGAGDAEAGLNKFFKSAPIKDIAGLDKKVLDNASEEFMQKIGKSLQNLTDKRIAAIQKFVDDGKGGSQELVDAIEKIRNDFKG